MSDDPKYELAVEQSLDLLMRVEAVTNPDPDARHQEAALAMLDAFTAFAAHPLTESAPSDDGRDG